MKKLFRKAVLAVTLAASALTIAAPAQARDGYRHHRGGGDGAAIAIGAGIIGLAVGAAIASDRNDDRYYDRGYYYDSYPRYRGGYYYNSYPRQYYRYDYRDARRDYRRDRRDWRRDRRHHDRHDGWRR